MPMDRKDVEYAAELARLYLSEEEKELYSGQLDNILVWIGKLNEADAVSGIESDLETRAGRSLATDKPEKFDGRETLIKNFTSKESDFLKVQKVI